MRVGFRFNKATRENGKATTKRVTLWSTIPTGARDKTGAAAVEGRHGKITNVNLSYADFEITECKVTIQNPSEELVRTLLAVVIIEANPMDQALDLIDGSVWIQDSRIGYETVPVFHGVILNLQMNDGPPESLTVTMHDFRRLSNMMRDSQDYQNIPEASGIIHSFPRTKWGLLLWVYTCQTAISPSSGAGQFLCLPHMNQKQKVPETPVWLFYAGWLFFTWISFSYAWFLPPIVFAIGAAVLYTLPKHGALLRVLVHRTGARLNIDSRRAQLLLLGACLLILIPWSAASGVKVRQQELQRVEAQRQMALADQQRKAAAAEAQRKEEARLAAAKIAAEKEEKRKADEDARQKAAKEEQDRKDREAQAAEQKRKDDERARQEAADRQARDQQEAKQAAAAEETRRRDEGPYTSREAENMCRKSVAQQFGVQRNEVILQGSMIEKLDGSPKNMPFGDGHVWFWRPTFKIAGTNLPFDVLCRVYDDGRVEVVDP